MKRININRPTQFLSAIFAIFHYIYKQKLSKPSASLTIMMYHPILILQNSMYYWIGLDNFIVVTAVLNNLNYTKQIVDMAQQHGY